MCAHCNLEAHNPEALNNYAMTCNAILSLLRLQGLSNPCFVAAGAHAADEDQYLSDDSIDPDDMTYEVLTHRSAFYANVDGVQ